MNERLYWLALSQVAQIGYNRFKLLLEHFQSAEKVWNLSSKELAAVGLPKNAVTAIVRAQSEIDPNKAVQTLESKGVQFICSFEDAFPPLLKETPDCPLVLYFRGAPPINFQKPIAVVGTRKITSYGKFVTEKIVSELVARNFTIVSGLALGVDAHAHSTTLDNQGRTLAVLGSGVDMITPATNYVLGKRILENGGSIVSEYAPGTSASAGTYPARNRIISGLSLGVVITEANEKSGSLITALSALEQNREVFAVPGPINSSLSKGPEVLIKQGAKLVSCADDIVEELELMLSQPINPSAAPEIHFTNASEQLIYDCILNESKPIDQIVRELRLPISQVTALLSTMELKGIIKSNSNRHYFVG